MLKTWLRKALQAAGYDLVRRRRADARYRQASHSAAMSLPEGAEQDLRADHPRLLELRRIYAQSPLPMAARGMWGEDYLARELDLRYFRGDNAYVWQFRNVGAQARLKYYLLLRDIAARDPHGWLQLAEEDGAFGCWSFDYPGWPRVSRDLLDSINELLYLDARMGLAGIEALRIVDIGAGYGRLAHRAHALLPGLVEYVCVDGVPESTFLAEYYLRHRGCEQARVLDIGQLPDYAPAAAPQLAVNIHSFSEMRLESIRGWLAWLVALGTQHLLVVPNDAQQMLSMEPDGTRQDFAPLFAEAGFTLTDTRPVHEDPTLRELVNVSDHYFFYRRGAAAA